MQTGSSVRAAALLGLLLVFQPARARSGADLRPPGPSGPGGALSLGKQDLFWISASILSAIPAQLLYLDMPAADTANLDRNRDLWIIDRWSAGTYSPAASLASDAVVLPLIALPMIATAWDSRAGRQTWGAVFADAVVYGEALSLSSSLDLLVRSARVHARPLVYGKDVPARERLSGEASGSFYSGHANGAFLSAVYFSYTYSLRHPGSEMQPWIWSGSLGAAALVAGLRVAAGKHYLSDVAVGAAAGSLFGWLFPWMHRKGGSTGPAAVDMRLDGNGFQPVLTWTF